MSVTTFDSSFSYRQNQVARLGEHAGRSNMSEEDKRKFQQSPFMQKMREIDEKSWQKFSERDKKRAKSDPEFKPQDSDFEAPKAHPYDKQVNYYKALGVDEYATCDEIKKSYRKLSLNYHPDKQTGKSQDEKDEASAIFMEIKNAYKTLSDGPTRRQYDYERDRDVVSLETHGKKPQEKQGFNAREALHAMMQRAKDNKKLPGEVVNVPTYVRLEKFVFGGQKTVKRTRLVKDRNYGGYNDELKIFRMDLPAGAAEHHHVEFRRQGDQHEERDADTLKFVFSAKSHNHVERIGQDLRLRDALTLGPQLRQEPYLAATVPVLAGRHVFIWGQNPFFRSDAAAEEAELHLKLKGLGVGSTGVLLLRLKLQLGSKPASETDQRSTVFASDPGRKRFLERFHLGPRGRFEAAEASTAAAPSQSSASQQLRQTRREREQSVRAEVELASVGQPIQLYTKPPSSMTFSRSSSATSFFAISLDCPACGKKKAVADWDKLKDRLAHLMQQTGFLLMPDARKFRPKSLLRKSNFDSRLPLPRVRRPIPWKNMGDDAFRQGCFWVASDYYGKRLNELRVRFPNPDGEEEDADAEAAEEEEEVVIAPQGADQVPESAKVLSNRAGCLIKIGHYAAALVHARQASEQAPRWSRPWSRLGQAAWLSGADTRREAVEAYAKAVEMEPSAANVLALQNAVRDLDGPSAEAAHAGKEKGNEAVRGGELNRGIATYTQAIARLPTPATKDGGQPDENALLRSVLFLNRSQVLTRLRLFEAAVADGKEAAEAQPSLASAHQQLGVALLGNGLHQEAYVEFAKAVQLDENHKYANKGRNTCLKEMVLSQSVSDMSRYRNRFWIDQKRPKGSSRIFAISDLHFDQRRNEDWAHAIDDVAFLDDVLILAGNVADSKVAISRALTTLKSKFRRVFYTVGNHEMHLAYTEMGRYPDSFTKLHSIFKDCDDLGIDVFPAPVCEGVMIVPLLSWCSAEFDEDDPFPDPNSSFGKRHSWPMDADLQLWKYMMKFNEPFLQLPRSQTVITFSHFLPRKGLPFDTTKKNAVKTVGCDMIDEHARAMNTKLHVYGHGKVRYAGTHAGVRYVSPPIGMESDWPKDHEPRLMMVHNGKSLCMQDWGSNDEPPLGYVKRILHLEFFAMPGLRESDTRKITHAFDKIGSTTGILGSFERLGSKNQDKAAIVKDAWPDLAELSQDVTHAILLVADDMAFLKGCLHGDAYNKELSPVMSPSTKSSIVFNLPLGLDLVHARKKDPMLVVFAMRLKASVNDDSDEYAKMQKACDAINKLPGIEGKISVALQPLGFDRYSHQELLEQLDVRTDKSAGLTHCFSVLVDEPASFKMLSQSKTFGKFKASYEPLLRKTGGSGPPLVGFAVPVEIAATAAAPKPEKPKQQRK